MRASPAVLVLALTCGVSTAPARATGYDSAATSAAQWLSSNQHADGSWCVDSATKALCTSEAVNALRALTYSNSAYYAGLTWLDNHDGLNVDYRARRIKALAVRGDDTSGDAQTLSVGQSNGVTGNKGWGLSAFYDGDALDTALVLRVGSNLGGSIDSAGAIAYLKASQLTGADRGWAVSHESTSDEIVTAEVIRSLLLYLSADSSLQAPISDAASALSSKVSSGSSDLIKAHAALALLSWNRNSSFGRALLDSLLATQQANGSWAQDAYLTALAAGALAVVLRDNPSADAEIVYIPDAGLRAAINEALGKNRGDTITRADMLKLTHLSASGFSISNLTGITYAANLRTLDLRFNQIASLSYFAGMTLEDVQLDGNPLSDTEDFDNDGLSDGDELGAGADPFDADSDNDSLLDGEDPYPTSPTIFPEAVDDAATTDEDVAVTVPVLENDTDADAGDVLDVALVSSPAHGTAVVAGNQLSVIYTPAPNYNGADSFTYKVSDGRGGTDTATVAVTVNPVNDAPVAVNDSYGTDEDVTLTIVAPGVLTNDTIADTASPTAVLVTSPSSGILTLNPNGGFTYVPNANFNGSDSFTYKARDGDEDSSAATVLITVRSINDVPVANGDAISLIEGGTSNALVGGSTTVLGNDADADLDALTVSIVAGPAHALFFALNVDGTFTYVHDGSEAATDSFAYKIHDGIAYSNVATVSVSISPVNDAPQVVAETYTTNEDVALSVPMPGVLANDTDADSAVLTAVVVTSPANGVLNLSGNGGFLYTPNANFNGSDSFTYKANDGQADSNTATVTIIINPVNDAPVAAPDSYSTNEDVALSVPASGVLANDTDADGNSLTAVLVSGAAHGNVSLASTGGFTYTPSTNYHGADSFSYRANDGSLNSSTVVVTLTVTTVNDGPPIAVLDSATTDVNTAVNIPVLTNDTDVDGDPLSIQSLSSPPNGTVSNLGGGVVRYTPSNNFVGFNTFTYVVSDGAGGTATGTVKVTVLGSHKQYVLDPAAASASTCVVSLFDNNKLIANSSLVTLGRYQRHCFSNLAQGTVIAGFAPFSSGFSASAQNQNRGIDMPVPKSFAGTLFVLPNDVAVIGYDVPSNSEGANSSQRVDLMAVNADAVVTISIGGSTVQSINVKKGELKSFAGSACGFCSSPTGTISSTAPIVVLYTWDGYRYWRNGLFGGVEESIGGARPLLPAATELWSAGPGTRVVTALENGTVVTNGTATFTLNASESREISELRVTASKPIAAYSYQNGGRRIAGSFMYPDAIYPDTEKPGESTAFVPKSLFARRYAIPADSKSIEATCYSSLTQITLTTPTGAFAAICDGTDTSPGSAVFNVLNLSATPAGSYLESTAPILVVVTPSESDAVSNLMGVD